MIWKRVSLDMMGKLHIKNEYPKSKLTPFWKNHDNVTNNISNRFIVMILENTPSAYELVVDKVLVV